MADYSAELAFVDAFIADLEKPKAIDEQLGPVDWIQKHFWIPELNGPIVLYPYQVAMLNELYRTDADGKFVYSIVIWSDVKKSAKSTITAAIALERARRLKYGSIKIVANDLKQAFSRVAFYARRAVELNPYLHRQVKITPSGYKMEFPEIHSVIEAVPVDPKGEAGSNDDLICFDEIWAANQTAAQRMWSEMTLSPTKFGYSQRIVSSYAGFSGESAILEQLYERGVKQGTRLLLPGAPDDLEVYANGDMLVMWNTKPRLPWQTVRYYQSEASVLTPSEFQRVHRNQWVSSTSSFIAIEWWDACRVDTLPALNRFREVVVGMDAAVSNDCFAIVALSRHGDQTALRFARRWLPVNGKIQYRNPADPADREYPEGVLRWLTKEYNVVLVTYDPYQLHSFVTDLSIEGIAAFEEFNQEKPRLVADKALFDCIRDRRIVHDGSYPDMREHLNNANSTAEDKDKLRIVKRSQTMKIDLAVALSMCNDRARWYLPE